MLDLNPMLLRNLSADDLINSGARLVNADEGIRSAAHAINELFVGQGEAPRTFKVEFARVLLESLEHLTFDPELVAWIVAPYLDDPDRIAQIFGSWRFRGSVRLNNPPNLTFPNSWIVVTAEDAMLDVLVQPFRLVSGAAFDMVSALLEWKALGIQTVPALKVADETTATFEMFVVKTLGLNTDPLPGGRAHFRFNATTGASGMRVDVHAKRILTKPLEFPLVPVGATYPWERNVSGILDESCQSLVVSNSLEDEALVVDPFYGLADHESVVENNEGLYLDERVGLPREMPGLTM